jgi:hypothetical protein
MFEKISNQQLVLETKKAVAEERHLTARVLAHLAEVELRRLHLELGFSSLFEFCLKELGYSESEAFARISAMRLAREIPEAVQAVEEGRLSLTNLAKAQSYFRQEKRAGRAVAAEGKREVLKELEGLSTRECEKRLSAPEDAGKRLISFMADEALQADLRRVREIWGNQDLSDAALIGKMATMVLAKIDPAKRKVKASVGAPQADSRRVGEVGNVGKAVGGEMGASEVGSGAVQPPVEIIVPKSRSIPASVRQEVWRRDKGQCTYASKDGRRCSSRFALQWDHLDPYGYGGAHTANNLRLLCRAHHRAHHQAHHRAHHQAKEAV